MNLYTERVAGYHEGEIVFVVEEGEGEFADVQLHQMSFTQETWHETSNLIAKAIMLIQGNNELGTSS